tara:strand:- start:118 stop:450 length:333 start_codon:yes stop_codon:yes gene_type:complete
LNRNINGLLLGGISGILVGIAGATKDAPYEGFKPVTFMRSPFIGMLSGLIVVNTVLKENTNQNKPAIFLSSIAVERMIVEGWKIIRTKMPSKFDIGEWGKPRPTLKPEIL